MICSSLNLLFRIWVSVVRDSQFKCGTNRVSGQTVFVLGAGASKEFGLPLGSDLQLTIADMMDMRFEYRDQKSGDPQIYNLARKFFCDEDVKLVPSSWLIRDGLRLTDSIDNFMEKHAQNRAVQLLGKLAIAKTISEAEHRSSLFVDKSNSYNKLDLRGLSETWVVKLFRHIQRGVSAEDIESVFQDVSFIVFNYDRCLEYFLIWALQMVFDCTEQQAAKIVQNANIYHPYGSLGLLPRMDSSSEPTLEFGAERFDLLEIAKRIVTYGEQIEENEGLNAARSWVDEAQQVVFLGFGFHPQNSRLIVPQAKSKKTTQVIGSAFLESDFNQERIGDSLRSLLNPHNHGWRPRLANLTCADLIQEFGRAFE